MLQYFILYKFRKPLFQRIVYSAFKGSQNIKASDLFNISSPLLPPPPVFNQLYQDISKSSYLSVVSHNDQLNILGHFEGLSFMLPKVSMDLFPLLPFWGVQNTVNISQPNQFNWGESLSGSQTFISPGNSPPTHPQTFLRNHWWQDQDKLRWRFNKQRNKTKVLGSTTEASQQASVSGCA